jgi:hypothetical protein
MFVHFTVTFERSEAASNPFHFVIPTGAKRSGGTCCSPAGGTNRALHHLDSTCFCTHSITDTRLFHRIEVDAVNTRTPEAWRRLNSRGHP